MLPSRGLSEVLGDFLPSVLSDFSLSNLSVGFSLRSFSGESRLCEDSDDGKDLVEDLWSADDVSGLGRGRLFSEPVLEMGAERLDVGGSSTLLMVF